MLGYIIVGLIGLAVGIFLGIVIMGIFIERDKAEHGAQTTQRQPSQMSIGLSRDDYAKCPDCGAGPFTRCSPGCHIAAQVEAALATVKS